MTSAPDMTSLADELKSCPFCGGAAMTSGDPHDRAEPSFNVHCSCCNCEGGYVRGKDCFENAIKHWNTRTPISDTPLDARTVEVCAKEAERLYEKPGWSPHYKNAALTIAGFIRALLREDRGTAVTRPNRGEGT